MFNLMQGCGINSTYFLVLSVSTLSHSVTVLSVVLSVSKDNLLSFIFESNNNVPLNS